MFQLHIRKYDRENNHYLKKLNKSHSADLLFTEKRSNRVTQSEDPLNQQRRIELATKRKIKSYTPSEGINEKEIIQISNFGISQATTLASFTEKIIKAKQDLVIALSNGDPSKIISIIVPLLDNLLVNSKSDIYACIHEYITSLLSIFSKELHTKLSSLNSSDQLTLLLNYDKLIDTLTKNPISNLYLHSIILLLLKPSITTEELKKRQCSIISQISSIPFTFAVEQYVWFMSKQGLVWGALIQTLINIQNKNGVGDVIVTHHLFRTIGELGIPLYDYISIVNDCQTISGLIKGMTSNEVSKNVTIIFDAILKTTNTTNLKIKSLCVLGRALGRALKLENAEDINIAMWKMAAEINSIEEMIKFSIDLIGCTARHCSIKTLDRVLRSITNKLTKFNVSEVDKLERVILQSIAPLTGRQICSILSSDGMSKIFQFLTIEQQEILASPLFIKIELLRYERRVPLNDIRVIQILLRLGQYLDSKTRIERMSSSKETEKAIMYFIECVDFGKSIDRQMTFYSDCRESFFHSIAIKTLLIHLVLKLTVNSQKLLSNEAKKSFVRGSLAFVYCTISELQSPLSVSKLSVLSCSVALKVESYAQADAFMKTALSIIEDKRAELEENDLRCLLKEIWGLSIVYPNSSPLQLPKQLMKIEVGNSFEDIEYFCGVLQVIVSFGMPNFIYHIENIESDDILFAGDSNYLEEHGNLLVEIISMIKDRVLSEKLVGDNKIRAVGLFVDVLLTMTEPNEKLIGFCERLIQSLQPINPKSQYTKYINKISRKLQRRVSSLENGSKDE